MTNRADIPVDEYVSIREGVEDEYDEELARLTKILREETFRPLNMIKEILIKNVLNYEKSKKELGRRITTNRCDDLSMMTPPHDRNPTN